MPRHSEDLPSNWCLGGLGVGSRPLRVDIHKGLLVNPALSLDSDYIKNVLATEIVGMVAFDLTTRLIILLLAFQSLDQCLGQENALVCRHLFQRSQPLLHGRKVMA